MKNFKKVRDHKNLYHRNRLPITSSKTSAVWPRPLLTIWPPLSHPTKESGIKTKTSHRFRTPPSSSTLSRKMMAAKWRTTVFKPWCSMALSQTTKSSWLTIVLLTVKPLTVSYSVRARTRWFLEGCSTLKVCRCPQKRPSLARSSAVAAVRLANSD